MPRRSASYGVASHTGSPLSLITPSSGWTIPARDLMSVDLPAPFSPTIAWTSPPLNSSDTSFRTGPAEYDLVSCSTASVAGDVSGTSSGTRPPGGSLKPLSHDHHLHGAVAVGLRREGIGSLLQCESVAPERGRPGAGGRPHAPGGGG